jgi:SM-20-related protein
MDRQLSSVLFLTESVDVLTGEHQHIGGNLSFRFLLDDQGEMLLIEPKPGLLIVFPSNPIFSHEVHEVYTVSSGFRVTIVNWYACA